MELRRGHAEDREFVLVDADGLAHNGWVPAEVRAPVAVAEDGDGRLAGSVGNFGGREQAADFGLNAEDGEVIAAHHLPPDALAVAFGADAEGGRTKDGDVDIAEV